MQIEESRKKVLAACGRGAGEEIGIAVPDNDVLIDNDNLSAQADQDDCGCGRCNRRGRVHCHAQRTIVGIALDRMHVGYLEHCQKREQDKAHHRSRSNAEIL